ncbi:MULTISPECIES: albusnodin family lasso peptide [unclassified Streptomyces]
MDNDLRHADSSDENELLPVELGDAAKLTEGQGGGSSEDKRRAYNS